MSKKKDDDGVILHTVARDLTPSEMFELRRLVAQLTGDLEAHRRSEDEAKKARQAAADELPETALYKARKVEGKRLEGELVRLARATREERLVEQVACRWENKGATDALVRCDTGEVLERRPAKRDDRQQGLDLDSDGDLN